MGQADPKEILAWIFFPANSLHSLKVWSFPLFSNGRRSQQNRKSFLFSLPSLSTCQSFSLLASLFLLYMTRETDKKLIWRSKLSTFLSIQFDLIVIWTKRTGFYRATRPHDWDHFQIQAGNLDLIFYYRIGLVQFICHFLVGFEMVFFQMQLYSLKKTTCILVYLDLKWFSFKVYELN